MAEKDPRVLLLTGDLGYSVLEPFQQKFPKQFINVGVAEQNMVGLATGLADAGYIPYVYSITTFTVLRPFEFIRNGPQFHQSKVRLIGVGCGFEYGSAGLTHHALEDVGVLRTQPAIKIVVPADDAQAENALIQTKDNSGPVYFRLSKNDSVISALQGKFGWGEMQTLKEGDDVAFLVMGSMVKDVLSASHELESRGIDAQVHVVSSIQPAPEKQIIEVAKKVSHIVTVESHYDVGGLGSLVAEIVAGQGLSCRVIRHGVKRELLSITGSERYLNQAHGLTSADFVKSVLSHLSPHAPINR